MTGEVGSIGRGLEHVSEHDVVHIGCRNTRARQRLGARDGAKISGGQVLQRAAEAAETGADARQEYDVGRGEARDRAHLSKYRPGPKSLQGKPVGDASDHCLSSRSRSRGQITVPLAMTAFLGTTTMPSRT